MKLGALKSLGHNIADSLASGIGILIGVYDMDVFGEASSSEEGYIAVDFLNGTSTGSPVSQSLQRAISLYREALPDLCRKHGCDIADIATLTARFGVDSVCGPHFAVTVETVDGRRSRDQYVGTPGRRMALRR